MQTGLVKAYNYDLTITQLFEKAACLYSDNVAVYLDQGNVSYRQFNEDVNQYAHYLREQGVSRNLIVAVEIPRSYTMLCVIFAILKAGGTYLPISPDYPENRKKQIIDNAAISFLITDSHQYVAANAGYQILQFSADRIKDYSKKNLESINHPNDIAYVIYTSGSTGIPKGVMIAHHSLINRLEWMQDQFPIGSQDVLFQKTHCGFDVSIWELFWWSIAGAGLTLLPHGREDDIILMVKTIIEKKVSVIHFVPSVLRVFLDYIGIKSTFLKLDSLKFVFSSGEALDVKTVNHFNQLFHASELPCLINLYGPTEATIDVTYFICDKQTAYRDIPIGKPIYNIELMVLDEFFKPQHDGQIGELYIAGVGVAKGYLNNPEQTERCFLKCPQNSDKVVHQNETEPRALASGKVPLLDSHGSDFPGDYDKTYKVIYKTGDLVKWNTNGELCYLGRKDHQVKINGIRIELGEIEHHLNTYANIAHAVVLYSAPDHYVKKLVAFIQPKNKSDSIEVSALKSFMQKNLPDYMLPRDYVIVDKYPLNDNGKLDRKKLEENYLKMAIVTV